MGNTQVQDIGNTCREFLVMLLWCLGLVNDVQRVGGLCAPMSP